MTYSAANKDADGGRVPYYFPCGGFYVSTPVETVLGIDTPAKMLGTTTAQGPMTGFTHANGKLTYTGTVTRWFMVELDGSMIKAAGASTLVSILGYLDGSPVTGFVTNREVPGTDEGAAGFHFMIQMAQDQYFEPYLQSDTGNDVTMQTLCVHVHALHA